MNARRTIRRLSIERLEDRRVLATFSVDNLNDNGSVGSLRWAIGRANAESGPDKIEFTVAGMINTVGPLSLELSGGGTTIDGSTAPGFVHGGPPVIVLNGPGTDTFVRGLSVTSANNEVRALRIQNYSYGIEITGGSATGNAVVGSYIGTDGVSAMPNLHGVVIDGASSNRIGTNGDGVNDLAERNVISGNDGDGIRVTGSASTNNVIAANYIGTNVAGTASVANLNAGIIVTSAKNTRIGTAGTSVDPSAERNVISGNAEAGIYVSHGSTVVAGTIIAGNYIGVDASGAAALPNAFSLACSSFCAGVFISSNDNRIGTNGDGFADADERNVIGGNDDHGVRISSGNRNVIAGNYIGTNATGTLALGNRLAGVLISSGTDNRVGTAGMSVDPSVERNVISGNRLDGVVVMNTTNSDTVVAGNYIGTNAVGSAALGNLRQGIRISDGAKNARIGTNSDGFADAIERNVIAANGDTGVEIVGNTTGTVVAGNFIGADATGTIGLPHGRYAMSISDDARIGTDGDGNNDAGEVNLINGAVFLGDGATWTSSGTVTIPEGGTLAGSGSVGADVVNEGEISPGETPAPAPGPPPSATPAAAPNAAELHDPCSVTSLRRIGEVTIDGDLTQTSTGSLSFELTPCTTTSRSSDEIFVDGTVTLNGALNIKLLDHFQPVVGRRFRIITNAGDESTGGLPSLPEGGLIVSGGEDEDGSQYRVTFSITYLCEADGSGGFTSVGNDVCLTVEDPLRDDIDHNGSVGLSDIAILARNLGQAATHEQGDLDGDGRVTRRDVAIFIMSFGRHTPPAPSPSPVPDSPLPPYKSTAASKPTLRALRIVAPAADAALDAWQDLAVSKTLRAHRRPNRHA